MCLLNDVVDDGTNGGSEAAFIQSSMTGRQSQSLLNDNAEKGCLEKHVWMKFVNLFDGEE